MKRKKVTCPKVDICCPSDIGFTATFDINEWKMSHDPGEVTFAESNDAIEFHKAGKIDVLVEDGLTSDAGEMDSIGKFFGELVQI